MNPAVAGFLLSGSGATSASVRLTQIKLAGFKSFVDPTAVNVPGQLVGVVGPNGCGKSNIIDAVRWVLGESKASALRGESMQDVIFNGAGDRKPVGRASVELFFDNSAGRIGGALDFQLVDPDPGQVDHERTRPQEEGEEQCEQHQDLAAAAAVLDRQALDGLGRGRLGGAHRFWPHWLVGFNSKAVKSYIPTCSRFMSADSGVREK